MKWMGWVLLAVILVSECAIAATPTDEQSELALPDLQGQQHSLTDYRGKVLVLNFWATWCDPCKHEMPLFVNAVKKYGADKVQVVAVSLDDASTRAKVPSFIEKEKISFPILLGSTDTMQKLGLGEALPATLFMDSNGKVLARVLGEISKSELKERVEWMLGMKKGQAPPELINNLQKKKEADITPVMH